MKKLFFLFVVATLLSNWLIAISSDTPNLDAHSAQVTAIIDNFDDNQINTVLWHEWRDGTGPDISEVNQRLEIYLPANSVGANMGANYTSNFIVTGDFDMEVEFSLLTWPTKSGVKVGLLLWGTGICQPCSVERIGQDPHFQDDFYLANFNGNLQGLVPTDDTVGRLRLTRVGTLITGFYFDGSNWIQLGSSPVGDSPLQQTVLGSWSHDNVFGDSDTVVAFDNFSVNAEHVIFPMLSHKTYLPAVVK